MDLESVLNSLSQRLRVVEGENMALQSLFFDNLSIIFGNFPEMEDIWNDTVEDKIHVFESVGVDQNKPTIEVVNAAISLLKKMKTNSEESYPIFTVIDGSKPKEYLISAT